MTAPVKEKRDDNDDARSSREGLDSRRRRQLTISIQSDKVLDSNWRLQLQSDGREMMGARGRGRPLCTPQQHSLHRSREEEEEELLLFIFSLLKGQKNKTKDERV